MRVIGNFNPFCHTGNRQAPHSASLEDLLELVRCRKVDEIVIALKALEAGHLAPLVERLVIYPVQISLALAPLAAATPNLVRLGGLSVLPVVGCRQRGRAAAAKRAVDVILATVLLVVLAPLLLLTALAIRVELSRPIVLPSVAHRL